MRPQQARSTHTSSRQAHNCSLHVGRNREAHEDADAAMTSALSAMTAAVSASTACVAAAAAFVASSVAAWRSARKNAARLRRILVGRGVVDLIEPQLCRTRPPIDIGGRLGGGLGHAVNGHGAGGWQRVQKRIQDTVL